MIFQPPEDPNSASTASSSKQTIKPEMKSVYVGTEHSDWQFGNEDKKSGLLKCVERSLSSDDRLDTS